MFTPDQVHMLRVWMAHESRMAAARVCHAAAADAADAADAAADAAHRRDLLHALADVVTHSPSLCEDSKLVWRDLQADITPQNAARVTRFVRDNGEAGVRALARRLREGGEPLTNVARVWCDLLV